MGIVVGKIEMWQPCDGADVLPESDNGSAFRPDDTDMDSPDGDAAPLMTARTS